MNELKWLAERFEEKRTRLRAVAYRIPGSLAEADDAVQETWLRLSRSETSQVENLTAWLTKGAYLRQLSTYKTRTYPDDGS